MNDKIKTPGMNNAQTYILPHNRFITYMVLIFSDLNKAQTYKMPYRDSPHREIEIVMSFEYLNMFKPNENKEDYYIRKPNNANLLFEVGTNNFIYVGEKVMVFKTNDIIVEYNSAHGYNDIKYPYAYGEENIYFTLHQKYIPIREYENSTRKDEYKYLYTMCGELEGDNMIVEDKGVVRYGNDFLICEIIHCKQ